MRTIVCSAILPVCDRTALQPHRLGETALRSLGRDGAVEPLHPRSASLLWVVRQGEAARQAQIAPAASRARQRADSCDESARASLPDRDPPD